MAELLASVSSMELGEWIEWYRRRDAEWEQAHPPPPATTPSGRVINTRGT